MTHTFDSVLVANRGEIAVRVLRSARAAGYRTVAVFSDADADAPHVAVADEAVCIGPAPVQESYLRGDKLIEVAKIDGANHLTILHRIILPIASPALVSTFLFAQI